MEKADGRCLRFQAGVDSLLKSSDAIGHLTKGANYEGEKKGGIRRFSP